METECQVLSKGSIVISLHKKVIHFITKTTYETGEVDPASSVLERLNFVDQKLTNILNRITNNSKKAYDIKTKIIS